MINRFCTTPYLLHTFSVKGKFCLWRDPLWNLQLQCNQSIVTWILDKGHNSLLAINCQYITQLNRSRWMGMKLLTCHNCLAACYWQGVVVADHTPFDNHHQQLLTNNLHQLGFPINSLALQTLSCKLQLSVTAFVFWVPKFYFYKYSNLWLSGNHIFSV